MTEQDCHPIVFKASRYDMSTSDEHPNLNADPTQRLMRQNQTGGTFERFCHEHQKKKWSAGGLSTQGSLASVYSSQRENPSLIDPNENSFRFQFSCASHVRAKAEAEAEAEASIEVTICAWS